jgi:hypothetical protein
MGVSSAPIPQAYLFIPDIQDMIRDGSHNIGQGFKGPGKPDNPHGPIFIPDKPLPLPQIGLHSRAEGAKHRSHRPNPSAPDLKNIPNRALINGMDKLNGKFRSLFNRPPAVQHPRFRVGNDQFFG